MLPELRTACSSLRHLFRPTSLGTIDNVGRLFIGQPALSRPAAPLVVGFDLRRQAIGGEGGAGVVLAEPPTDPVRAVLQEVLNEFERTQLLLRLSPRLREKHAD